MWTRYLLCRYYFILLHSGWFLFVLNRYLNCKERPLINSYREYDFISVQIDGVTDPNFYCSFEGLYYYAFHLAEIIWGMLWLYDVKVLVGKPGLFTGKYLMYYACAAYFTAFGFSIVLYFQDVDNFTSAANLLCFVVDDDSLGYYLMFNIPIVLYFLLFVYIFFAYEQGFMNAEQPKPKVGADAEQNLLAAQKPTSGPASLSPSIYNKLHMNMKIQRIYFVIWFLSIIPNFFLLTETGLVWYSIFNALHPIVIIVIILWAISINAQSLERQSGKEAKVPGGGVSGQEKGMELSDYSSFIDDRSDVSAVDGGADIDIEYRKADQKDGKGFED